MRSNGSDLPDCRRMNREVAPYCVVPWGLSILSPQEDTLVLSMGHDDGTPQSGNHGCASTAVNVGGGRGVAGRRRGLAGLSHQPD